MASAAVRSKAVVLLLFNHCLLLLPLFVKVGVSSLSCFAAWGENGTKAAGFQ